MRTSSQVAPRDLRKFFAATQYGQIAVVYIVMLGTSVLRRPGKFGGGGPALPARAAQR
jgi:hypothetical protein